MITQAIMRIMSKPHALNACTVIRAKALAGSTHGIRDYLYPPFAQLVISSSRSVYNTTCFIALVFHGHNKYPLRLVSSFSQYRNPCVTYVGIE